tara:strand:- start:62 stop:1228 length:1167 start_codon:yes stop_codon:yes gene_type:complete
MFIEMEKRKDSMFKYMIICGIMLFATVASGHSQEEHIQKVERALSSVPLFDGHNDLPWLITNDLDAPGDVSRYDLRSTTIGHTDIRRLRAGMVGAQFWSVYIPMEAVQEGAARVQLEQIDIARRIIRRYPDVFEQAYSTSDVRRIFGSGRVASVLGMEGGHAIENSLGALRSYFDLGVRYMTLTHNGNNDWADACCEDSRHGGLTDFGIEVVREMNRLGMLVDLSHTSLETMNQVLDVVTAPVIFSHSSAREVTEHPRNVSDEILRRLPENGGVVMVTFVPGFISMESRATLTDVVAHIEHVVDVAGINHVGIGSDFDGIDSTPLGLEDVSTFPSLFVELSKRGWTEQELMKLAGQNVLRAWSEAEVRASQIQRDEEPSIATLEKPEN